MTAAARRLTVWAVSDGRAGIENQVLGLAEAVARLTPADIVVKRVRFHPWFDRWPTALKLWPDHMLAPGSDRLTPPWPDIWIAAGRASLPFSLRMRQRGQGQTLVIQLQDPRAPMSAFDVVIAPEHDQVQGDHVLSLIGSTHRVTAESLQNAAVAWQSRLAPLPAPRLAVLIGGRSKTHDLSPQRAQEMATQIRQAVGTGSVLMTLSRRTPDAVKTIFRDAFNDVPGIVHDGTGPTADPSAYFAFLSLADAILVTEDSVNMTVEAASTGKPVYRLAMDRIRAQGKFAQFHAAMDQRGITRPFDGQLETWSYTPLNETERAAHHVLEVLRQKTR